MAIYERRLLDERLDDRQPRLRAIALQGPKGVGKTATATERARTVLSLQRAEIREQFTADPDVFRTLPGPVLIDEWQRWPESWDRVREAVDDGIPHGHVILAGSSAPRGATVHSGAGRIVPFRMRPLSFEERQVEQPHVSLAALLTGEKPEVSASTDVTLSDYVEEIVASGLPGIRPEDSESRLDLLDAYVDNIVQREFPEQGYAVRRPDTLRRWLTAYAAATSTTTSYNRIIDAATPGESDKPALSTTITYRDALTGLWLLDALPAWSPSRNSFDRLVTSPKHQLADPALAARLLGATQDSLRLGRHSALLGPLFEHLVALSVQTYADINRARTYHLRTRNGDHEVDLVVERRDGAVVALETKLAASVSDADVKHLHWLRERIGDELLDAAVITTGGHAYRRRDGIAVVPLSLLGH
ncbi:ATP-binding protein [Promicromonospora sp. NPDC052451]|uniref:ATP-binding protein n=1 Tax=unclassified Promicromonospora TaxID=2647929 RepID=UPI0037C803E7